jgi:outer membrane immunogenic protein
MAGPAFGANMVSPSYGSSPYAWTGFYAGIDAGYDWNLRSPLSNSASFGNTAEFGSKGGSIGATIGFDYQFARRWVAGAAFDANLEDVEAVIEGPLGSVSAKIDRSIALRLRAGYLISPSTLIYATGGWVGMHSVVDYSVAPLFVSGDTTQGGFVVGGGIETAITHNLFVRAEYLHSEYASSAYFSTSAPARSSVNAARIGVTYKFGMPEWGAAYATEEAPLRASWTGFYGGIGAGYGASNTSIYLPPPSGYTETGAGAEGLSGVLSAGFDYQFGASIVAGIVADAAVNGATTDFFGGGIAFDQPRSLSLRGRLGYLLSGDTLIFASAGWSASRADFSAGGFEKSDTLNGFVFGGGIETMVTEHVALRAEYLHTLEAKMPISIAYELKQQNGVARTSLIYRF